jgi:hypothetical protein
MINIVPKAKNVTKKNALERENVDEHRIVQGNL